ncbi:amidase [Micromonospora sp. NPDC047707]|uniref:amidase n=1 Tax=Micromonospora sp. NPDC047707 TaxID=3154498 RepID=UPI003451B0C4
MDPFMSATAIARAIRARDLSPAEVVDTYLDRIDRFNGGLNAIIWRDDAGLKAAAEEAERAVLAGEPLGPFHGVPIPIKDLTSVAGQPNTMGSRAVSAEPRVENDLVVDRLAEAGFLFMGRSNTPEMGPMTVTENLRYGNTANPWHPGYSPAGSSGGAAVAVAAGMAPVAHGNDGGGSLRMPASACGLVGLKPSRARVPQRLQSWWEYGTSEGVITRYLEDTAGILDAISRPDPHGWFQAPPPARPYSAELGREPGRLRVGLLLDAPTGLPVDPDCVAAATGLANLLERMGHDVYPVEPIMLSQQAADSYVNIIMAAALYAPGYDDPELAEPYNGYRREHVKQYHAGQYVQASALLQSESRQIVAQWGRDFDLLLTPTMACVPPALGSVLAEANGNVNGPRLTEIRMVSFTVVCNVTGLPAISLPVHFSPEGLPVGAQLIGAPFDEATLIRLAALIEPEIGWVTAVPPRYR